MDLKRRFRIALIAYAVLAALILATNIDAPVIRFHGRAVNVQLIALAVVGLFAVKTILHWKSEQIRAEDRAKRETHGESEIKRERV